MDIDIEPEIGAMNHTIEAIRARHPSMADILATAAKDLQFGRILRLIESAHGDIGREDQA